MPALVLDDGGVLTENAVVLQYIADQNPGAALAPAHGTFARYRLAEWLNYIATEIHKRLRPAVESAQPGRGEGGGARGRPVRERRRTPSTPSAPRDDAEVRAPRRR